MHGPELQSHRRSAVHTRLLHWGVPAAVLGIAAATRLIGLEHPDELVFDETYYVKDAESLRQLGYEGRWPENANELWSAGTPGSPSEAGAFIAHPPLGKWVMALGLALLGPENPAGWRLGTAIAGVALVGLTMLLAHLLFARLVLTGIAGFLLAIDGNGIVMSRVSLLDGVLATIVVLAVVFVVLDRQDARAQLAAWLATRRERGRSTDWGPALWGRPWLVAAGVTFGLAIAVKWSALYVLAAFAVLTVIADAVDRRRAGIALWASGTLLKQAPTSSVLMIPAAAAAHLITWWGWFSTSGGYGRDRVVTDENRLPGILGQLPDALQNWWEYQTAVYGYHVGESSPHGYESPAALWPLLVRPTYMHYVDLGNGTAEAISGIPNPLIWWASWLSVLAIIVALALSAFSAWAATRRARGAAELPPVLAKAAALPRPTVGSTGALAIVLTGVGAGWLPWLLYPERTMFFFYTIVITPFLVLALTSVLGAVLGPRDVDEPRRSVGIAIVVITVLLALAISVFFLPLWTGAPTAVEWLRLRYWLPTWV